MSFSLSHAFGISLFKPYLYQVKYLNDSFK